MWRHSYSEMCACWVLSRSDEQVDQADKVRSACDNAWLTDIAYMNVRKNTTQLVYCPRAGLVYTSKFPWMSESHESQFRWTDQDQTWIILPSVRLINYKPTVVILRCDARESSKIYNVVNRQIAGCKEFKRNLLVSTIGVQIVKSSWH